MIGAVRKRQRVRAETRIDASRVERHRALIASFDISLPAPVGSPCEQGDSSLFSAAWGAAREGGAVHDAQVDDQIDIIAEHTEVGPFL